jgi:hypothetical protein
MLVTELTFLSDKVFRAHGVSEFSSEYFDKDYQLICCTAVISGFILGSS